MIVIFQAVYGHATVIFFEKVFMIQDSNDPLLFKPLTIMDTTFKNRIFVVRFTVDMGRFEVKLPTLYSVAS